MQNHLITDSEPEVRDRQVLKPGSSWRGGNCCHRIQIDFWSKYMIGERSRRQRHTHTMLERRMSVINKKKHYMFLCILMADTRHSHIALYRRYITILCSYRIFRTVGHLNTFNLLKKTTVHLVYQCIPVLPHVLQHKSYCSQEHRGVIHINTRRGIN